MRIWIDDVRPAPEGYVWCKSVNDTKAYLEWLMKCNKNIELLDIDHDAGEYANEGGDYIEILNWLEEYDICYFPIHIHSMNVVGKMNMEAICRRNGWTIIE